MPETAVSLAKPSFWGVLMYYSEDKDQVVLAEFLMPFAGKLDPQNRWVRLASIMPWDKIEGIYLRTMSIETGRKAISARIAFGAIYIKESENLTDEGCVTAIRENQYMQYFLGLHEFQQEPLFDASMMVHFHRLIKQELLNKYGLNLPVTDTQVSSRIEK